MDRKSAADNVGYFVGEIVTAVGCAKAKHMGLIVTIVGDTDGLNDGDIVNNNAWI